MSVAALETASYVEFVPVEPLHTMRTGASEAVSIEKRCSRAVQVRMHVLTAAEHTAEVWEAAVSALCNRRHQLQEYIYAHAVMSPGV